MREPEPTIERGYAADATSRQAFMRNAAREAADAESASWRARLCVASILASTRVGSGGSSTRCLETSTRRRTRPGLSVTFLAPRASTLEFDALCKDLERVKHLQAIWQRRR